jgi:hypothetical protein
MVILLERVKNRKMVNSNLAELGQEHAAIILRQETGMDFTGDTIDRFQPGDALRLLEIESLFKEAKEYTLSDYLENYYEMQKGNLLLKEVIMRG